LYYKDHNLIFGRNNALVIHTTLQKTLYDVINNDAYKKGPWEVEVVVNAQTDNTTVTVVG